MLNMFDKESYIPTGVSVLQSADSELKLADSSVDSNAAKAKVGMWVWAFRDMVSVEHMHNRANLLVLTKGGKSRYCFYLFNYKNRHDDVRRVLF